MRIITLKNLYLCKKRKIKNLNFGYNCRVTDPKDGHTNGRKKVIRRKNK